MDNIEQNEHLQEESASQNNIRLRDQSGYRVSPFVYEHGFFNGVLDIQDNDFHQFIRSSEQKKMAYVRLKFLKKTIDELKLKIADINAKRDEFIRIISTAKFKIPAIELEIEDINKEKGVNEDSQNELKKEKGKINPYYNKLIASIFIFCAIIFLFAETVIIHDIFLNVLQVISQEAWLIAVAISLSSFAMKPTIDRIFEEPFLMNKNPQRVKILLACFSILLLIALGLLGHFRTDAFLLILKQSMFPDEIKPEEWFNTMGGATIHIFFVLFGILLAVSGAICFSVGLPVFKLVKQRKQLETELKVKEDLQKQFNLDIQVKRQKIAEIKTDWEVAELNLNRLEDVSSLETRLQEAYLEELEAWETMFEHQTNAEISWYEEGRHRGIRYTLADELIIGPIDINKGSYENWPSTDKSQAHRSGKNDQLVGLNGNFLHEKVRSLIDYNLNRKPKLNGHHE